MRQTTLVAALAFVAGCSLIDTKALQIGYSFDPQEFKQTIGMEGSTQMLPVVACTPGMMPDPCAALNGQLPPNTGQAGCNAQKRECQATAEVRLPQRIDLRSAQTPVPSEVISFGVSAVAIERVSYWVVKNSLNVPTPPIDVFVAGDAARDESDPSAVKLGSIASLPAGSDACGDTPTTEEPAAQMGKKVCNMQITDAGQRALGDFIKNFKAAPFQLIVRATLRAEGGTPVPAGTIDLFVRPRITFSILK